MRNLFQLLLATILWAACQSVAFAAVSINGVDGQERDNILAYLRLDDEACDAPGWRIRRLFADSEAEIREALEVVGYYNVEITRDLQQGGDCWQAEFGIAPGPPVVLRNVSIEIDTGEFDDAQLQAAIPKCDLNVGDVFQHANYDACRRRITRLAESRGYFSKEYAARRVDVYPEEDAADITLHLQAGQRYVFGEASFDQGILDPELIKRFIDLEPGEPYDAERVRRLQRDLVVSAYFDQVIVTPAPRAAPYFDVPINVELTPGKKYQFSAGVGFSSDVGLKLRGGILNRRLNDGGQQGEVEVNLSKVISDIGLSYRIPLDKPRDWVTFDTGYKLEDNDSFNSALFTAGAQRIQQRRYDWLRTLFLELRLEDYEAGTFQDGYSQLLTPGISYSYVNDNNPRRPLSGHRTSVLLRGALDGVISDTSFLQVYGQTKWVFALWPGARLLTRADVGFTVKDEFVDLPATVRFFAGGDVSVRGYAYDSLGPTDPLGAVVGGSNLLVGSIEVDQMVAANWSIAAFIDSGNAYDKLNDFNPATGVGGGVRWFSPLGPIRIDIGIPLEKDAPDNYRLHISLGPDL